MFLAWKHGGHDPYRLFNTLGEDYRPVGEPSAEPRPPVYPERVRNVIYGFALVAQEEAFETTRALAGSMGAVRAGTGGGS